MTTREINEKARQAYRHAVPEVWDEVLSDCREQKENMLVMTLPRRKPWVARMVSLAACLCLLIGAGVGFLRYRSERAVDATVSLDVNPSIEIRVNQKERVLEVVPLNEDGRLIVGDLAFSGSSLDVTVYALIGSMLQNGYLNELTNSILISVDNSDPARGAAMQERLTSEVNLLLQTDSFNGAVLSQTVTKTDELQQLAEQYGITMGKAQLIKAVLSESTLRSFADLVPLSINELNLLLSRETAAATHVEVIGAASDKAYIGEARAREIALEKAGLIADSTTAWEIEMDLERGVLVYELEFLADGCAYDVEIDAVSGEILKFKTKRHSTPAASAPAQSGRSDSVSTTELIGEDNAGEIALEHAGVDSRDAARFRCKLEREDGLLVYEIEFYAGGCEYDYEIDAASGAVLKYEKDLDD